MPIRTTADRVTKTAGVPANTDVDIFIETASAWIDARLGDMIVDDPNVVCQPGLAELEILERYLAAHLYLVAHPPRREEQVDSAHKKLEGRVEIRLDLTRPGQQLLFFDRCRLFVSVRMTLNWIGTPLP